MSALIDVPVPECTAVTLTYQELYVCSSVAAMRFLSNLRDKIKPKHGAPSLRFDLDFLGCVGEMATAKHFNLFWAGQLGDFKAVDVGGRIQVRAVSRPQHQLILHPEDDDARPFVLALAHDLPRVRLAGWIMGRDGKQRRYWDEPVFDRPAFFVPQRDLRDMAELDGIVALTPHAA